MTRVCAAGGIVLALLWTYVVAVAAYGEVFSARLLGYWMGSLLIPFASAYLVGGRQSNRSWIRFSVCFMVLGFVLPTLSWYGSRGWRVPSNPKDWVARRVKEAAGVTPVSSSSRLADREMDTVARDAMREMLDYRKQYNAKLAAFNDGLGKLYSAESFSNEDAMQRSTDSIQGVMQLDRGMSQQIQQWPDSIKARLARSSASEAQKQAFLQGVTRSFTNSEILAARNRAMEAESAWAEATLDLYAFALQSRARIYVRGDQVVIPDSDIRTTFNDKLQRSQALQETMVKLNTQLEELQNAKLKQYGLSKKELGVE